MPPSEPLLERALSPLDDVRSLLLRHMGALLRPWLRDRSARVASLGALSVGGALALVACAPVLMLSWAPLVLGVPHLLGDLRYLVARQQLHRRRLLVCAVAPCLVLSVVQMRVGWGACAVAVTALLARAPFGQRALVAVLCLLPAALSYRLGPAVDIIFAHGHNLVALFSWLWWSRKPRSLRPAMFVFALGVGLLFSGALDHRLVSDLLVPRQWAVSPSELLLTLSPTEHPVWSIRFLGFFALAQSVHYSVWLKLVPEEDRARSGIRSFKASYRALTRDLGAWLPVVALSVTAGFCLYAGWHTSAARSAYLRIALFHGPLEIAVLALLLLERRAPIREGDARAV